MGTVPAEAGMAGAGKPGGNRWAATPQQSKAEALADPSQLLLKGWFTVSHSCWAPEAKGGGWFHVGLDSPHTIFFRKTQQHGSTLCFQHLLLGPLRGWSCLHCPLVCGTQLQTEPYPQASEQ